MAGDGGGLVEIIYGEMELVEGGVEELEAVGKGVALQGVKVGFVVGEGGAVVVGGADGGGGLVYDGSDDVRQGFGGEVGDGE